MSEKTIAERLDKIEAAIGIQQLPPRYALGADTRNLDAMVALYVEDVAVGAGFPDGRAGLRRYFDVALQSFYRTFHQIVGHTFELIDADHATGTTACVAQHEVRDQWVEVGLCYFDKYERRDGRWFFAARRDLRTYYYADMKDGPRTPYHAWPGRTDLRRLPGLQESSPTWDAYWKPRREIADSLSLQP